MLTSSRLAVQSAVSSAYREEVTVTIAAGVADDVLEHATAVSPGEAAFTSAIEALLGAVEVSVSSVTLRVSVP